MLAISDPSAPGWSTRKPSMTRGEVAQWVYGRYRKLIRLFVITSAVRVVVLMAGAVAVTLSRGDEENVTASAAAFGIVVVGIAALIVWLGSRRVIPGTLSLVLCILGFIPMFGEWITTAALAMAGNIPPWAAVSSFSLSFVWWVFALATPTMAFVLERRGITF